MLSQGGVQFIRLIFARRVQYGHFVWFISVEFINTGYVLVGMSRRLSEGNAFEKTQLSRELRWVNGYMHKFLV